MFTKCENNERPDNGLPCTEEAEWVVQIGTRSMDAQESCTGCLGFVCQAMFGAEGRPEATLRIKRLFYDDDSPVSQHLTTS